MKSERIILKDVRPPGQTFRSRTFLFPDIPITAKIETVALNLTKHFCGTMFVDSAVQRLCNHVLIDVANAFRDLDVSRATVERWQREHAELAASAALLKTGIPMLIWCPSCRNRHVDEGEWATRVHHTHSCQHCGMTWRPAVVPTVGVLFLPGFVNAP